MRLYSDPVLFPVLVIYNFTISGNNRHHDCTMSATITKTNSSQQAPARLLADYDLHHSGQSNPTSKAKVGDEQDPVDAPYWNVPHRRVPAYRPVDTNRDQSQIRVYNHPIERMFITTMFTGVFINAVSWALHERQSVLTSRSQQPRFGGLRLGG